MESVDISQQSGYCGSSLLTSEAVRDQFPAGLRVLLVDDDITCLKIIEQMLKKCMYAVTTCDRAAAALSLLREKKGDFDVVISDVHMPDMDGFKLLEIVGFEMDLPVIMMSADRRTSTVMRGVKHGACDFLIKPVRMEELNNIWQHVVRKKSMDNPENEQSGGENNDGRKGVYQEVEIKSSVINCSNSSLKVHRKRKNDKDEDYDEQANDDQAASKKSRVVWSVELHEKFVNAVSQLGIDKAVPKRILELMNVPDLSRENVASHLQKFRLYLKRISGVAQNPQNQGVFFGSFGGSVELNQRVTPTASINMQPLAVSGWTPQQPFASFRSCHSSSFVMPPTDQSTLIQAALIESKGRPMEHIENISFITTQAHLPKPWAQMNLPISDNPPGYSSWQQHIGEADQCNSYGDLNSCRDNFLDQQGSVHFDSPHAFNTRPTRVLASPVSCSFLSKNVSEHSFGNHNPNVSSFTGNSLDYKMLSPPSIGMQRSLDGDPKSDGVVGMYSPPISVSSSASSCAIPCEGTTHLQSWPVHNSVHDVIPNPSSQISNLVPNASEIPFGFQDEYLLDQGTPTTGRRVVNAIRLSTLNFTCESGQGTGFGHEHLANKDMNTDFRNLPK